MQETHSISAGLDYSGRRARTCVPENDAVSVTYIPVGASDDEALEALEELLLELEGIS